MKTVKELLATISFLALSTPGWAGDGQFMDLPVIRIQVVTADAAPIPYAHAAVQAYTERYHFFLGHSGGGVCGSLPFPQFNVWTPDKVFGFEEHANHNGTMEFPAVHQKLLKGISRLHFSASARTPSLA